MKSKKIKNIIKHIAIFAILIGILTYILLKDGGIISKSKNQNAQEQVEKAMEKYAKGEYQNLYEAIKEIKGYKGIRKVENGFYMVNIEKTEVLISHTEELPTN